MTVFGSILASVQLRVIAVLLAASAILGVGLYVWGLRASLDAAKTHAAALSKDLDEAKGKIESAQKEVRMLRDNEAANAAILADKIQREKELLAEVERYREEESHVPSPPVPAECVPSCSGFVSPVVRAVRRVRSLQDGVRGGPGAPVAAGPEVSGRPARP